MQNRFKIVTVGLLFVMMLVIGISIFPSYGISADEEACRYRAIVTTKYLTELVGLHIIPDDVPLLTNYVDRDHGVIFDLVAYGLEKMMKLDDSRQIFIMKHLLNYLVFFAGVIAIYQLTKRRFNSWVYGSVAALFLFLSPRIFADAFYNPKDLVFMATYVIAMNTALAFLANPTVKKAVFHALATALAIDTRIMGVLVIPMTLFIFFFKIIDKSQDKRKNSCQFWPI